MKKKLILVLAIIMVIAMSVTMLVSCNDDKDDDKPDDGVITTVEQFIAKLDTATSVTFVKGDDQIQFDGTTIYTKDVVEGKTNISYDVIEGDNLIIYRKDSGAWTKRTEAIPSDIKVLFTIKKFLIKTIQMPLDITQYDKADGVWTLKSDNTKTIKVESGKLVVKNSETTMTVSLDKITITLPDEVKNAQEETPEPPVAEITTVEEFIAAIDTATSIDITHNIDALAVKFDGTTFYHKLVEGDSIGETYDVIEGNNNTHYSGLNDVWTKSVASISDEEKAMHTVKVVAEKFITSPMDATFDADLYNIEDGVWTLKADNTTTLRIENGKLRVAVGDVFIVASLDTFTIELPDDVKNAEAMMMTVEEFLTKLNTATSYTISNPREDIRFDGTTIHNKVTEDDITVEAYVVMDGDNFVEYYTQNGIWFKRIEPISDDQKGTLTVEITFGTYYPAPLDPELYDKADGVWTLKENNSIVLRMKDGELVTTVDGVTVTANLDTFTITLPDEVKNAVVKPV